MNVIVATLRATLVERLKLAENTPALDESSTNVRAHRARTKRAEDVSHGVYPGFVVLLTQYGLSSKFEVTYPPYSVGTAELSEGCFAAIPGPVGNEPFPAVAR